MSGRSSNSPCLKTIGKLSNESERLIITGTRTEAHSFKRYVGIGQSSHCLLGREFKSTYMLQR